MRWGEGVGFASTAYPAASTMSFPNTPCLSTAFTVKGALEYVYSCDFLTTHFDVLILLQLALSADSCEISIELVDIGPKVTIWGVTFGRFCDTISLCLMSAQKNYSTGEKK